jgi:heptose I phosphotransferase
MTLALWNRLARGMWRLRQRGDWPNGPSDWPERLMDLDLTDRYHAKQGRSIGRCALATRNGSVVVYLKRHHRLPRWHGILATLWPRADWSPALQEWRHLEWARTQGMPVPSAVVAGERIGPWGRLQGFLAVEELTDMLPLHEAVPEAARRLPPVAFLQWKRGLLLEMARLARELHARRWFHKDLYLCHFYIPRKLTTELRAWQGEVYLIDLHRLGYHPWTWRMWQTKDLAQLLYSTEIDGIDDRDRLRFWRAYQGEERRRGKMRWWRQYILFKWRRYRRHNQRKQRG